MTTNTGARKSTAKPLTEEKFKAWTERVALRDRGAFKIKEAAIYLGVSVMQVRRYIRRGLISRLPGIRHVLITRSECDRFLSEQQDIARVAAT
jgi:excisionase family DNA binding protein